MKKLPWILAILAVVAIGVWLWYALGPDNEVEYTPDATPEAVRRSQELIEPTAEQLVNHPMVEVIGPEEPDAETAEKGSG